MKYNTLSPHGISVQNIDVSDLSESKAIDLARAISEHGFAVIGNQSITDSQFVDFLETIGPMTFTAGESPVEGSPQLNYVSNVGRKNPRSVFHSDTSYVSNPPSYTALRAVEVPDQGGETLITNQYRAYETLLKDTVTELSDAKVLHIATGVELSETDESRHWHPLFRIHPVTKKVALFLSTPERCIELSGYDAENGSRIIHDLYQHSTAPDNTYRHQWSEGDVLIWDNRCTMHRADHSAVLGNRTFHRGLVSRERSAALSSLV